MSVIVEVTIPSEAFELGRILRLEGATQLTLETLVPLGGTPTPFVRVRNDARETFERSVRDHPAVNELILVNTHADEALYTLDWEVSEDSLFQRIFDLDAVLLDATGAADTWELKLRFPTQDALSAFQEYYAAESITVSIERVYVPTRPDAVPSYGLTTPQWETLACAAEAGYYSVPRQISTRDLADRFDISNQADSERLRRGVSALVTNTLLVGGQDD